MTANDGAGRPRLCVYCGSNLGTDPAFAASAVDLGRAMAARGIGLVYGGGHVGMMGTLADAVLAAGGEVVGVITEQLVDAEVAHRGVTTLEVVADMHQRKTGAMLSVSVLLGAACGQQAGGRASWLARYGHAVGLAFQVVDDILDVTGDAASLGKTAGKDADHGKPTYVSILGLDASRHLAAELLAQAREAVAALGPGAGRLGDIAELIVMRQS